MSAYRHRLLDPDDPADLAQRHAARWHFIGLLREDLRVHAAWNSWLETPAAQRFVEAVDRARTDGPACYLALLKEQSGVAEAFSVVLPEFSEDAWVCRWLADRSLVDAVRVIVGGPEAVASIRFQLDRPLSERKHRMPKGGFKAIARNVRWFYLSRIKQPPVSIRELARRFADTHVNQWRPAGKYADARAIVRDGARAAQAYLELAAFPLAE